MDGQIRNYLVGLLVACLVAVWACWTATAEDGQWHVSKASGDVSLTLQDGQRGAATEETILNPGETVRTGPNGRVLLVRGEETILVSPNSVIVIPAQKVSGLATTILQPAGTTVLEVEKRNVKHFEVETPYLAAVVKGTKFRVTVNESGSTVDVIRGEVEVTDFKSGQYALVQQNQAAKVAAVGTVGLSLSGTGVLAPVRQGTPRHSSISPATIAQANMPATKPEPAAQARPDALLRNKAEPAADGAGLLAKSDTLWDSILARFGKGGAQGTGRGSLNDDISFTISVAAAVGVVVAIGVGVGRRRQRRKQT